MKHSPGPWTWTRNGFDLLDAEGVAVAVGAPGFVPDDADARLIAAAPELLDALRSMTDSAQSYLWVEHGERHDIHNGHVPEGDARCGTCQDGHIALARALLARIDGKDPTP